ncbi:MAG TPA: hypothetical protein VHD90_03335 [Phototrophicaceae bacterium]|nr:hypothetical protein [Phototrophicaceae bacterium]
MALQPENFPIPMHMDDDGTLRVRDTKVSLEEIITRYQLGYAPERTAGDFSTIKLADVYVLIAYYLNNRDEIDVYVRQQEEKRMYGWDSREKLFERFGEHLMHMVRDKEIHYAEAFLDQKAPAAYGYKEYLDTLSPAQIEFLKKFAVNCINGTIHDFLYMLEDADWIHVRLENADTVLEDIRRVASGDLQGYTFIWAERYSKKRLDGI